MTFSLAGRYARSGMIGGVITPSSRAFAYADLRVDAPIAALRALC